MSLQAVDWVLRYAPDVEPHYIPILIGIAEHCDSEGRGAYPSPEVLGMYARRDDKRNLKRSLRILEEKGLIVKGDQDRAAHLPKGRRPIVWDLPLDLVCPDRVEFWAERRRNPGGQGGRTGPRRGGAQAPGGGAHRPPLEGRTGPPSGGAQAPQSVPTVPTVPLSPRAAAMALYGAELDDDEREKTAAWLEKRHKVRQEGWWHAVAANGSLGSLWTAARAALDDAAAERERRAENARQRRSQAPSRADPDPAPARCPHGRPLATVGQRYGCQECPASTTEGDSEATWSDVLAGSSHG